jgi:hypothetical protein
VLPQKTPNISDSNPMDTSMVVSGTDISQSLSKGKIVLETMDQTDSPSQRTTKQRLEKKVKESPLASAITPPQSVKGEDWSFLQPKTSIVKKLFKQKSPTKLSAIGVQGGLILG